jgi:hypothetical protein
VSAKLAPLADNLVALLAAEPTGMPCDRLARRVRRRRHDVLAALHVDVRFEQEGRTHGSRWRLSTATAGPQPRDGLDRYENGACDHRVGHDGRGARAA